MRSVAVIAVTVLALLPAGADARHASKRVRFRPGAATALVGWLRPAFAVAPVAPIAASTAAPAPAPASPTATPTPTPAPTTVPGDNPHSVSVRSTEFRLSLSQPSVEAGEVRVQFDNSRAEDPHALAYAGPSSDTFDPVAAGAVVKYTVTLSAGTYKLFCPLPEHEGLGMKATLTVR